MMTIEQIKRAIKNKKKIYEIDYLGVTTINFGEAKSDFVYDEFVLYKIKPKTKYVTQKFLLRDLFEKEEEAQKEWEEWAL